MFCPKCKEKKEELVEYISCGKGLFVEKEGSE